MASRFLAVELRTVNCGMPPPSGNDSPFRTVLSLEERGKWDNYEVKLVRTISVSLGSSAHGGRAGGNEELMKNKPDRKQDEPEMRAEYDFSHGVRGKYVRRYSQGTNVVVLEPDVAKVFSNAQDVNRSLRALAGIIRDRQDSLAGK
jgi:hypothetical protein